MPSENGASKNPSKLRYAVAEVISALEKSLRKLPESPTTVCDSLASAVVQLLPPEEKSSE